MLRHCIHGITQKTYDRLFENFKDFLSQQGVYVVSVYEAHLANFLTLTACHLARPKTTLHGIVAAVDHGCVALGLQSLVQELVWALIKCETQSPLSHFKLLCDCFISGMQLDVIWIRSSS